MPIAQERKPKVLLWDLETSPNQVYTWRLGRQVVRHNQLIQPRSIICGSYKYLDDDKVHTISIGDRKRAFRANPYDDEYVVKELHKVLSKADVLVAHNGDRFDLRFLTARTLRYGLSPLPIIHTVDTLAWARKRFDLESNSLDYISRYLGLESKGSVGFDVWRAIIERSDPKALKLMEEYNAQDVIVLEDVYKKLRPYMTTHPNINLYMNSPVPVCPVCGSAHLQKRGTRTTRISEYQRYQCTNCGAWSHSGATIRRSEVR